MKNNPGQKSNEWHVCNDEKNLGEQAEGRDLTHMRFHVLKAERAKIYLVNTSLYKKLHLTCNCSRSQSLLYITSVGILREAE